ncbi:MAG TPA: kynureninase [Nitriliruptoraceae bacterium]|nr:kynureninase [Nitriliruptoraceae bacterium]
MDTLPRGPFPDLDGHDRAVALDAADPLSGLLDQFVVTDPDLLYLDGNSLGRLPAAAAKQVRHVVDHDWGDRLIRSWNEGWWDAHVRLGDALAPVVGARPGEVIISESTSTNLFKLAMAGLRMQAGRHTIVTDDLNFPTDNHVLAGVADVVPGGRVVTVTSPDGIHGDMAALRAALDDDVAIVSLSHVAYKSGWIWDIGEVTSAAHDAGAMVLWDCSHSVGAVPVDLAAHDADMAVGCTYKYLNGGPGAPAFAYVRNDLQERFANPITGWWGHAEPFSFDLDFRPAPDIRRVHVGTVPMLSLLAAEAGITMVADTGIDAIRAKSIALTSLLVDLADQHLAGEGFSLASPRRAEQRGGHVSLAHEHGWGITRALIEQAAVVPDFRAPDVVRLGLSPLTTSFLDVHTAVGRIREVVRSGGHLAHDDDSSPVT